MEDADRRLPTQSLRSVSFVTPQSGWAVGDGGTILHTERRWRHMEGAAAAEPLHSSYSVSIATPRSGWVVGEKGIILRTDDGGGTWKVQISNTRVDLMSVTFAMPR